MKPAVLFLDRRVRIHLTSSVRLDATNNEHRPNVPVLPHLLSGAGRAPLRCGEGLLSGAGIPLLGTARSIPTVLNTSAKAVTKHALVAAAVMALKKQILLDFSRFYWI